MAPVSAIQGQKAIGLVLSGSSLKGDRVVNHKGEDLGKIEEIMIDLDRGRVAYAVCRSAVFWLGDKLFAIPWQAFTVDTAKKQLVLNADKALLEKAPGFDKNNWPDMADLSLGIHALRVLRLQALLGLDPCAADFVRQRQAKGTFKMRIWILMMFGVSLAFGQTKPIDTLQRCRTHFGRRCA